MVSIVYDLYVDDDYICTIKHQEDIGCIVQAIAEKKWNFKEIKVLQREGE